uniref:Gypsy retrotransposon integrase-like protein 1 n=1 Tax=Oryzias latipes TaxID=8090 RepID=A0A3P9LUG1_ORYLA
MLWTMLLGPSGLAPPLAPLAVKHFRTYLLGTRFTLRTDHASLTWLLNFRQPEGQVARWIEVLQEYDFSIHHRPGQQHANADALSRRPCLLEECRYCRRQEERNQGTAVTVAAAVTLPQVHGDGAELFSQEHLQEAQEADQVLAETRKWVKAGQRPDWSAVSAGDPELKTLHSQWGNLELHNGVLYRRWRAPGAGRDRLQLLVPTSLRDEVLHWVHGAAGAGHFRNTKTVKRLRARFYWPGCRQAAELHVHCCDLCTAHKGPTQQSRAPLQQYLVGAPMERVGVDVLGPFPLTESGNRYVLVAMDYFTKWPEVYAVPDQSATTTAKYLVEGMFTRFGVPNELHSDQGRNFESRLFAEVCKSMGVRKTRTTPLHPQSDGLVERFNRTLATQLATLTSTHQRDWDQHLPLVLWAYRTAVQESSQCTPALLMFGRELRTPVDLVFGAAPEPEITGGLELDYVRQLKDRLGEVHRLAVEAQREAGVKQKRVYDTCAHGPVFGQGDRVWVYCPVRKRGLSPKLMSHWQGPGEILEQIS